MVAEPERKRTKTVEGRSLAKISMVAELRGVAENFNCSRSLAKISMVAEQKPEIIKYQKSRSLAKISMVAEPQNI